MGDTNREGILSQISSWMKLLGLIVLVAESVIIAAMSLTPVNHPIYEWYPVLMLIFLVLIVVGIFVDRYSQRKSVNQLTLALDDKKVTVDTSKMKLSTLETQAQLSNQYSDSEKGFGFELPSSPGWGKPQHLDVKELLLKLKILPDEESFEPLKQRLGLIPMGNMLLESNNILIQYGEGIPCELTDDTSNAVIDSLIEKGNELAVEQGENMLSEEETREIRKNLLRANNPPENFITQNMFGIHVYDKSLASQSPVPPTLGNLFLHIARSQIPIVDKLVSNDESILWGWQQTMTNVLVGGSLREVTTYTMNGLFENENYLLELNIVFSPQTDVSITVWNDLQNMFQSLRVN